MKIIIDTREQKKLWHHKDVIIRKLDVGDYNTPELEEWLCIERKSPGDLYGSILGGHERFRKELYRAINKNKDIYVFVECSKEDFVNKKWDVTLRLQGSSAVLAAIINTLEVDYDVVFVWCDSRSAMRREILSLMKLYMEKFIY